MFRQLSPRITFTTAVQCSPIHALAVDTKTKQNKTKQCIGETMGSYHQSQSRFRQWSCSTYNSRSLLFLLYYLLLVQYEILSCTRTTCSSSSFDPIFTTTRPVVFLFVLFPMKSNSLCVCVCVSHSPFQWIPNPICSPFRSCTRYECSQLHRKHSSKSDVKRLCCLQKRIPYRKTRYLLLFVGCR